MPCSVIDAITFYELNWAWLWAELGNIAILTLLMISQIPTINTINTILISINSPISLDETLLRKIPTAPLTNLVRVPWFRLMGNLSVEPRKPQHGVTAPIPGGVEPCLTLCKFIFQD